MYTDEELFLQLLDDDQKKDIFQNNEEDIYMQLLDDEDLLTNNNVVTHHIDNNSAKNIIPKHVVTKPTITCPYCQSTNTKKISGTARFMSTGIFGLASGKIGKQWHCNSCKSDF